jgi:hypothetical protein
MADPTGGRKDIMKNTGGDAWKKKRELTQNRHKEKTGLVRFFFDLLRVARLDSLKVKPFTEFFKIKTVDNVEMDGWMVKPANFDPAKKYPVVFYVYTEPFEATVTDSYGRGRNYLYLGDMAKDGYIYISLDNRGTPAPKGAA